jgi:uncharacterized protein involved in exopolysaccharide biosynthesis
LAPAPGLWYDTPMESGGHTAEPSSSADTEPTAEPGSRQEPAKLRGRLLVVASTLIAAGVGLLTSLVIPKQYTAEALVSVRDPIFSPQLVLITDTPPSSEITGSGTGFRSVSVETVADRIAETPAVDLSEDELAEKIELQGEESSEAIAVEVTDRSPERAAALANNFARIYTTLWRDSNRRKVALARAEATPQVLDEGLVRGDASLLQRATPTAAHEAPKPLLSTFLAGALGLFLGLAIAIWRRSRAAGVIRWRSGREGCAGRHS